MIIAIDGPSASGKSSVSKDVAKKINFRHLDTGAMFRALTWFCLKEGIDVYRESDVTKLARSCKISYEYEVGNPSFSKIFVNDIDVTSEIRKPYIDFSVTPVCSYEGVRNEMLLKQRKIVSDNNYIVDGRDIGTVVFPDAHLKIYLTADSKIRAKRRYLERNESKLDPDIDLDAVHKDLLRRDSCDKNRKCAPLKQAKDAILIDSTDMTLPQVADKICKLYFQTLDN